VTLDCRSEQSPDAQYVDTGDPLPEWANAVIPIENVEPLGFDGSPAAESRHPYSIRIRASVTPWQHVRPMGEDMVATQLVLPSGHVLGPVDIGALAASGHVDISAARQPRVAIIPTGTELVPVGQPVQMGDIIEYNSIVMAGQINQWGGAATRYPIIPDQFEQIQRQVAEAALKHDLVLVNAGSSAGSEDYTADVVETLGEVLVHGVAVRPGHPVIIGMIDVRKAKQIAGELPEAKPVSHGSKYVPVIGVPGYPVSAALTLEIFVEPVIAKWLGRPARRAEQIEAKLTRKVTSPAGDDDYMRVAVGQVGDQMLAAPLARGSGVISSLVRADGILILPRGSQGLPAGANVRVHLYRAVNELKNTIFAIGSHDMILDLLAQHLILRDRRLASANVGSVGGLVALSRGEAHLAGSHLLDPDTGEYNVSYIRQYLPSRGVKVVAFLEREQGLLVPPGNPKGIKSLDDLSAPSIRFVNRQRGSGTRVLLDYYLKLLSIAPDQIKGYTHEEFTHLAVAAAVASGRADCGLGIAAAAKALEMDFVPLYHEKYELVIPDAFFDQDLLKPLFDILIDSKFQQEVASLPGYSVDRMGDIVAEISSQ
jgi:putative molybdopterin biosynthesis protein